MSFWLLPYLFFSSTILAHSTAESSFALNSLISPTPSLATKERFSYTDNISVQTDNFQQAVKLFQWLDLIRLTQLGQETIAKINQSGKKLLIYHNHAALLSAGTTGAALSRNLTNGVGENAYIKFYLNMDKDGTHCVLTSKGHYIPYLAIHNLFHELVHAKHKMLGTWLYFDSEGQAIKEENIFRRQWAQYRVTSFEPRYIGAELGDVKRIINGRCT